MLFNTDYNDGMMWIDCETTGTDYNKDIILEIGMQLTDILGNNILQPLHFVISRTNDELSIMDDRTHEIHTMNNLINDCMNDNIAISNDEAYDRISGYIEKSLHIFDVIYISGFSVSFDKLMINKHYDDVLSKSTGISHRLIDITTLNILSEHLNHDLYENAPKFNTNHRSLTCIKGEIERYIYYRQRLFNY